MKLKFWKSPSILCLHIDSDGLAITVLTGYSKEQLGLVDMREALTRNENLKY